MTSDTAAERVTALQVAATAGAAEEQLWTELAAALRARGRGPGSLARPLRIVVPSHPLRDALARRLLHRAGRPFLGVILQSHRELALETLHRAGDPPPGGDVLVPVLVARRARDEPPLAAALGALSEGFAAPLAVVRDLLDAGFRPHHLPAALEWAEAATARHGEAVSSRVASLLRIASGVCEDLETAHLGDRSTLFERAAAVLAARGQRALPTAGLWIYGYADATGTLCDWLAALVRCAGARVIVERPIDPADPTRHEADYSAFFLARLAERLGGQLAQPLPVAAVRSRPAGLRLLRAPDPPAELRAVVGRVRALLDVGVEPEEIALVAKSFEDYRSDLRCELERLAIPFSAPRLRSHAGAAGRRVAALATVLAAGGAAPLDAWLAADPRLARDAELRLGFHALGLRRLSDLASFDAAEIPTGGLALPLRQGFQSRESLPRPRLEESQRRARTLLAQLAARTPRAPWSEICSWLQKFLQSALGWRRGDPALEAHWDALAELDRELPDAFSLSIQEWQRTVLDALASAAEPPLGGRGGGVQLLRVVDARGLRFAQLFLLGVHRNAFPSPVAEDALLPDALRLSLQSLLPDLPLKARLRDEERHLFASALASAECATVSWPERGAGGRSSAPSPFLLRLRAALPELEIEEAPPLRPPHAQGTNGEGGAAERGPRPAAEWAAVAALAGDRPAWRRLWPSALDAVRAELEELAQGAEPWQLGISTGSEPLGRVAAAQCAVLDAHAGGAGVDTEGGEGSAEDGPQLGPFHGLVGAPSGAEIRTPPSVTYLGDVLQCPWRAFLSRELGLRELPDAWEAPFASLARLRGSVVHETLESIARESPVSSSVSIEEALAVDPRPLGWPEGAQVEAILGRVARELARREGVPTPGFVVALARSARGALARARANDVASPAQLYGVELAGSAVLEDGAGRVRFRVDRVEARDDAIHLVEYKTGRTFLSGVKENTRTRKLPALLWEGQGLQIPVYLLGLSQLPPVPGRLPPRARLVFLGDGIPEPQRVTEFGDDPGELLATFAEVARTALEARREGAFPPRLIERGSDREPRRCGYCSFALACLRGEGLQRRALAAWRRADLSPGATPAGLVARRLLAPPEPGS